MIRWSTSTKKNPSNKNNSQKNNTKHTKSTLSSQDNMLPMAKIVRIPIFVHQGNSSIEFKYTVTDKKWFTLNHFQQKFQLIHGSHKVF